MFLVKDLYIADVCAVMHNSCQGQEGGGMVGRYSPRLRQAGAKTPAEPVLAKFTSDFSKDNLRF